MDRAQWVSRGCQPEKRFFLNSISRDEEYDPLVCHCAVVRRDPLVCHCAVVRPCQIVGNCEPHLRPGGGICLCVCAPTQGMREAFRRRKIISKPGIDFFAFLDELDYF